MLYFVVHKYYLRSRLSFSTYKLVPVRVPNVSLMRSACLPSYEKYCQLNCHLVENLCGSG